MYRMVGILRYRFLVMGRVMLFFWESESVVFSEDIRKLLRSVLVCLFFSIWRCGRGLRSVVLCLLFWCDISL